ncbi:MAG: NUDIX domain-containing protein [Clostridia bacterium]
MDEQTMREIEMMEEEFLAQYDSSQYEKPSVTVDVLIFNRQEKGWELLLVKRKNHPFQGKWALPGGFINMDENLEDTAYRELMEETGLDGRKEKIPLKQLGAYGDVGRDPRGRTITVVYVAILEKVDLIVKAADDATDARWFPVDKLPPLAFDHDRILEDGKKILAEL